MFEKLNGSAIYKAALHCQGSGGPSGANADCWKRVLCGKGFKSHSKRLCDAIANVAKRLCTENIDPLHLQAFNASRLIPLDKNPGVRPIGIGETIRRIIGKSVMTLLKGDVTQSAGALQVCAGQDGGCEAAIHAMKRAFGSEDCEAVLLVDASNAFNNLNRKVSLENIKLTCPKLGKYLHNIYQTPTTLNINGSDKTLLSKEGTTQGENAASAWYAISTVPLMLCLPTKGNDKALSLLQAWFADDSAASGLLSEIKAWWDTLLQEGTNYGYLVNSSKTWLIVKDPAKLALAKEIFKDTGVQITCDGKRHLGAALGSKSFKKEFISKKVREWVNDVELLSNIAESQPQLAYAAFTKGLAHKWLYYMRTLEDVSEEFKPLEDAITNKLLPAMTGITTLTRHERQVLSLPCRLGGLGIEDPSSISDQHYTDSVDANQPLTDAIFEQQNELSVDTIAAQKAKKALLSEKNRSAAQARYKEIYEASSPETKRCLTLAQEKGASSWLTSKPIEEHDFILKGEGGGVPWVQIMENELEYLDDRGGHGGHLGEKFVKKYCS